MPTIKIDAVKLLKVSIEIEKSKSPKGLDSKFMPLEVDILKTYDKLYFRLSNPGQSQAVKASST